jgi:hypothetical protein
MNLPLAFHIPSMDIRHTRQPSLTYEYALRRIGARAAVTFRIANRGMAYVLCGQSAQIGLDLSSSVLAPRSLGCPGTTRQHPAFLPRKFGRRLHEMALHGIT